MAYLALYRKYRPKNFNEVIGQDYVNQILKNQIISDRIGHAYLFTGIRGTGKTSIAKIFARAVNCTNSNDGNPCGVCETCQTIEQPGVMDIIEIDAASNRGVDEIRDIRDKVKYPPKIGRYKVYIIDEVHMLTKEAFNALLKTLEEPPAHVVFILATTEPNKLPATILSRCQRFDIRPISQEKISKQITTILNEMKIEMEPDAIKLIASRGDHSMRDALSILDQAIDIRQGDESISLNAVLNFLGMTNKEIIINLIKAILNHEALEVINILNSLKQNGIDSLQLMNQVIDTLREFIIVKTIGEKSSEILEKNSLEIKNMMEMIDHFSFARLYQMSELLIEDRQKMRYNDLSYIILEMALLKLCNGEEVHEQKAMEKNEKNSLQTKIKKQDKKSDFEKIIPNQASVEHTESVTSPWEVLPQGWKNSIPEPPEESIDLKIGEVPSIQQVKEQNQNKKFESNQNINNEIEVETKNQAELTLNENNNIGEVESKIEILDPVVDKEESTSDLGVIAKAKQAVETWKQSQDFFTAQIATYGNLKQTGKNHFEMVFHAPEHNMYAEMFSGRIQNQVQEVLAKALNETVRLIVSCTEKNYEDMDLVEKTSAIVGDDYREKIQVTD